MFQKDYAYSKIGKLVSKNKQQDSKELILVLLQNYQAIKNLFILLASKSSYPTLSFNETTKFIRNSNLIGKDVTLARMDQLFIATNVSQHKYKQNSERALHRYEFMEFLVRLAMLKYMNNGPGNSVAIAVSLLLENFIYPNNHTVDGVEFRKQLLYPNWLITELFAHKQNHT